MRFLRVIGVILLAVTLAGCTLSEKQFHDMRIVLKQRPDLRAKINADCTRQLRSEPRSKIEVVAEVVDLKVSTFPQAFCQRMMSAYLSGRMTYADYKDLARSKPTPRLLRILRGKRP